MIKFTFSMLVIGAFISMFQTSVKANNNDKAQEAEQACWSSCNYCYQKCDNDESCNSNCNDMHSLCCQAHGAKNGSMVCACD